jgi:rhodanese-related sulfurtransferase
MKHVTVHEAHDQMQQGAAYLDVRSTREFAMGHPAGAFNVPILEPDEDTGVMQANPDFVAVMKAVFPAETKRAAQILEAFGFTDVANVRGGFGGGPDPMGRQMDPGWASAGLPVETTAQAGRSYAELAARAANE